MLGDRLPGAPRRKSAGQDVTEAALGVGHAHVKGQAEQFGCQRGGYIGTAQDEADLGGRCHESVPPATRP